MKRLIATAIAAVGGTFLVTSAVLFTSGLTGMNTMLQPEPASGFVEPGPDATPYELPSATPQPVDPTVGGHDINPFEVPAGGSPEEIAHAKIFLEQSTIVTECMRQKGFDYPLKAPYQPGGIKPPMGLWPPSIPPEQQDAAFLALFGDTGYGADYHWQDAGCTGLAVHETGQDDVH